MRRLKPIAIAFALFLGLVLLVKVLPDAIDLPRLVSDVLDQISNVF